MELLLQYTTESYVTVRPGSLVHQDCHWTPVLCPTLPGICAAPTAVDCWPQLIERMYAEQAHEAAQKEAQRLAEEEELREHRRNLQFKVRMEDYPRHTVGTKCFLSQERIPLKLWQQ